MVDKRSKVFCMRVVLKGIGGTSLEVCCEGERHCKIVDLLWKARISKFVCLL